MLTCFLVDLCLTVISRCCQPLLEPNAEVCWALSKLLLLSLPLQQDGLPINFSSQCLKILEIAAFFLTMFFKILETTGFHDLVSWNSAT